MLLFSCYTGAAYVDAVSVTRDNHVTDEEGSQWLKYYRHKTKALAQDTDPHLKMFDRSGMTSKSAFIKARIFGEPFHVVTFDKSQHEYYAKFFAVQSGKAERSDFHAQFRMVGNRSAYGRFACKEL